MANKDRAEKWLAIVTDFCNHYEDRHTDSTRM